MSTKIRLIISGLHSATINVFYTLYIVPTTQLPARIIPQLESPGIYISICALRIYKGSDFISLDWPASRAFS
jgi:hypothetical protein